MSSAAPQVTENGGSAPTVFVPDERIVSIEHPYVVKNFGNGFKSLGGEHQLKHVLEHEVSRSKASQKAQTEPVAGVSLRPNDPFAKKLASTGTVTQNVLIKVTVPKRTGRKRKRGSNDPLEEAPPTGTPRDIVTAPELLQRLRDNADVYSVQAVGTISDTHRFLDLPDFQIRADEVPIMREIRDHAMEPDYENLKTFGMNLTPETNGHTAFPGPPSFAVYKQPYDYEYHAGHAEPQITQNDTVRATKTPNSNRPIGVCLETEPLPQKPPKDLEKLREGVLFQTIKALGEVLDQRPVVSKNVFHSMRPGYTDHGLTAAIPYVGYYITSGPWRYTIAKYGFDPRRDPGHRFYQSIMISRKGIKHVETSAAGQDRKFELHVFDGRAGVGPGNLWQLCDLTDPTLHHLIHNEEIRDVYEPEANGWYYCGTMAKIRVIMRDKMLRLANKEEPLEEAEYMALAALPKIITRTSDCDMSTLPNTPHVRALAYAVIREAGIARRAEGGGDEEQEEAVDGLDGAPETEIMNDDADDEHVEFEGDVARGREGSEVEEGSDRIQANCGDERNESESGRPHGAVEE